jgi:hypothetical protein
MIPGETGPMAKDDSPEHGERSGSEGESGLPGVAAANTRPWYRPHWMTLVLTLGVMGLLIATNVGEVASIRTVGPGTSTSLQSLSGFPFLHRDQMRGRSPATVWRPEFAVANGLVLICLTAATWYSLERLLRRWRSRISFKWLLVGVAGVAAFGGIAWYRPVVLIVPMLILFLTALVSGIYVTARVSSVILHWTTRRAGGSRPHWVTWIATLCVAVALTGSQVVPRGTMQLLPGTNSVTNTLSMQETWKHGWPRVFVKRVVNTPIRPIGWSMAVYQWSLGDLAVNLALWLVLMASTVVVTQRWAVSFSGGLQFSLRTLLAVVAIVAVLLGANPYRHLFQSDQDVEDIVIYWQPPLWYAQACSLWLLGWGVSWIVRRVGGLNMTRQ